MNRLHPSALGELKDEVRLPSYDHQSLRAGIVHLGLGAFHRAHQAVFTEDAIELAGGDWGIIGVSIRSAEVSRQLLPQAGLYSVWSEDAGREELRIIGALRDVLVAPQNPAAVVAAIADQSIKIITLTITEKGYSLAADGRSLDLQDSIIKDDLANRQHPSSALGLIALGLRARMHSGGAALTILSCDNLSQNSRLLRAVLVDYLALSFPEVIEWLDSATTFPCSVVDRIVPAMTAQQKQRQALQLGLVDESAVTTEPFSQWIIEDRFAGHRPAWDKVGVQLVEDVLPFETIKLRLLNAAHSAIAYCGLLTGMETVDEVMADAPLRSFIERLMAEELMPALDVPEGFDLGLYRDQLLQRFENPCLRHRCQQIAMDGSEKILQRWLPTLEQLPEAPSLVKALSAWCYFILQTELPIDDPRKEQLTAVRASDQQHAPRLHSVLACARITSGTVADFPLLCRTVEENMRTIESEGVRNLLEQRG
jgi:fructuronate reductase